MQWSSLCLFVEDGRVAVDSDAAERALHPIGVGRRNWLFAGTDTGAGDFGAGHCDNRDGQDEWP